MFLFFSAQDISSIEVGLLDAEGRLLAFRKTETTPEKYLATISGFLAEQQVFAEVLEKIIVVSGPGAFTASRLTVTIANALSFAKNIPVVGVENPKRRGGEDLIQKFGKDWVRTTSAGFVNPTYDRPPNITLKKQNRENVKT